MPLPEQLTPCPIASQIVAAVPVDIYRLDLITNPPAAAVWGGTDPNWQFLQAGSAVPYASVALKPGGRWRFYNPAWNTNLFTWAYYYGGPPNWPITPTLQLLPSTFPVPFNLYQKPPPLVVYFNTKASFYVYVYVNNPIVNGPADTSEWVVHTTAGDLEPFSVAYAASYIQLAHLLFASRTITRITYTKGPIPFTDAAGGELRSLDYPYPQTP